MAGLRLGWGYASSSLINMIKKLRPPFNLPPGAIAAGIAPDLRASGVPLIREAFENVVKNGALSDNGMPIYRDLTDEQLESLRHYIRSRAEVALRANQ